MERVIPPAQASSRQTELGDAFDKTLFDALDAVKERKIPYALIGGIAASGLGRPRSTHDIDIFVRPEDAEAVLEALGSRDFDVERTDPRWLFKGWKNQMMVDIIFKSQGDIYFDNEMQSRVRPIHYHGRDINAVSPEDLIIIKCAVHSEVGPHHWHDALAVLSHATLDWKYLLKRSRRASRRLLALLIYAQSNDIWIPNHVILDLFATIFSDVKNQSETSTQFTQTVSSPPAPQARSEQKPAPSPHSGDATDPYLTEHIRDALATDPRTGVADIQVAVGGRKILVKGEAQTGDLRNAIEQVTRDQAPNYDIDNQIRVSEVSAPEKVGEVI